MDIAWSQTMEELQNVYTESYKYWIHVKDKENIAKIIEAKDKRKSELEALSKENEEIDQETGEVK